MSYTAQYWLLSNRCAVRANEIPTAFRRCGLGDLLPIEEKAYAKVNSQKCRRARTGVLGQERAVYGPTISMVKLCGRGNFEGWTR